MWTQIQGLARYDWEAIYARCHGPVVLQWNMTVQHQDTSVSRSAFHLSKQHKRIYVSLCMHYGPHKPISNDSHRVLPHRQLRDLHRFSHAIKVYTIWLLCKYPCSLCSTFDHVPRFRGTPLHSSSPTLTLVDKLFKVPKAPMRLWANPCVGKLTHIQVSSQEMICSLLV